VNDDLDYPRLEFDPGRCKSVSLKYCCSAKRYFRERKRSIFIYALIDPSDGLPFYIGKTYNPAQRFQAYDYLTRRPDQASGSVTAIAEKFHTILTSGAYPVMRLLRRTTLENGALAEARTVRKYLKLNPKLMNRVLIAGDPRDRVRG
jgi:hypothetical protein